MSGPLNGVRVLDLTAVVSGPFATMFLADQGADVLKIEPIGGDITRRSRATSTRPANSRRCSSPPTAASARCRSTSRAMPAARCWQSWSPGRRAGAELSARHHGAARARRRELRARHPRLIYVSISGVGDTGPYVKKRVYDPIIQGLSGFADIQSQPVDQPAADDPHHRLRQDHGDVYGAGGIGGALCAREDRAGRSHPGGDARYDDLLSLAGRHDAIHGGRRRGDKPPIRRIAPIWCSRPATATSPPAPSRIPSGRAFAGPPAIPTSPRIRASPRPAAARVNATARINKMAEYIGAAHHRRMAGAA